MTEAQEVESLDRVLTRLALTDEKDLEKVRCWPTHACHDQHRDNDLVLPSKIAGSRDKSDYAPTSLCLARCAHTRTPSAVLTSESCRDAP